MRKRRRMVACRSRTGRRLTCTGCCTRRGGQAGAAEQEEPRRTVAWAATGWRWAGREHGRRTSYLASGGAGPLHSAPGGHARRRSWRWRWGRTCRLFSSRRCPSAPYTHLLPSDSGDQDPQEKEVVRELRPLPSAACHHMGNEFCISSSEAAVSCISNSSPATEWWPI